MLHDSLRNILREVVISGEEKRQQEYLLRVYKWYYSKMQGCGAMGEDEKEEEERFINPGKFEKLAALELEEIHKKKEQLADEEKAQKEMMDMFRYKARTQHKEIPPAADRIADYIRKPMPGSKDAPFVGVDGSRPVTKDGSTRPNTVYT